MEWITRLNEALCYIEEHLAEDIRPEPLARIACCSAYHFQRMFTYLAGIPLSEYIRRRRMSQAAADLQAGREKITEIALKYGYTSPTAFNRAFQSIHGVSPSAAKKTGASIKSYPPIQFQLTVRGIEGLDYRIEEWDAFRIAGISQPLAKEVENNFMAVPQMWQKAAMDGTIAKLAPLMSRQPMGLLGVSACNDQEAWKYFIAVSTCAPVDEVWETYTVPAATWAIFTGTGTNRSIQELERRIVTEWLPASGFEYADAPDMEVYLNADPDNAQYEVWIPVHKKEGA